MEEPNSSATNPVPEEAQSSSSSLTLSLTPPLSDPHKDDSSTISEHLSSIENDRSMQELEISNVPENFQLLLQNLPSEDERISQEPKPPSLNSSFNHSSIISLNGLERIINTNMEGSNNAKSILEEILGNEQFKSDSETQEESLDIFANVDLDDKLLNSYNCEKSANFKLGSLRNDSINNSYDEVCKRVRDFEELIAIKDNTIAALNSELDSFRELLSNTSSLGTSTTEYKQFQEECHNKLVEYHNAIVHKDDQIEKLTGSLQQCILNREEMKQNLKNEIEQLKEQLEKTSIMLKEHKCTTEKTDLDFDSCCSKLEAELSSSQINLFNELKVAFNQHLETKKGHLEEEIHQLKAKFECDKAEQDKEIVRLRELLENVKPDVLELKQELDAKHSKEMEELRTYFEKKCADLEKNYSEEVFSQHSRKMSGSSSATDTELSSDFVYNQPGPGGDAKIEYTKKDITKLSQTLTQMTNLLEKFNLSELKDEEFDQLKLELTKFDLKNLLKYDLTELQNKYHAELEILREDFDNRVDVLNVEHENKIRSLEKKYLEEIDDLNTQLRGRIVSTAQQEVRLVANESVDDEWPEELLQLKARFAEKYQKEIVRLNEKHSEEITRLKEEHSKTLNSALERARRRSLRDADSLSKGELELLKERDALKKQTLSLRNLLGELIKYFTQCEDELNNTLVEELITKNFTQIEKELEVSSPHDSLSSVKRVHITPNFNDLINLIDNSPDNDLDSVDLKSELGTCLEKLKSEANAILSLSTSFSSQKSEKIEPPKITRSASLEKEMTSLTRKLINETQLRNELSEQLHEAKSIIQTLETDRCALENQIEELIETQKILESDLLTSKEKIAELIENGHKEIVSEGYGENGERVVRGLAEAVASLTVLQEKARVLSESSGNLDTAVVRLIEDLARVGSKIVEEAKRERDDLKQQVEHLEQQVREMSKLMENTEKRCKEVENENKEAVDKIFELRDIIRDLEEQVKMKSSSEEQLRNIVSELEVIVKTQTNEDLQRPRDVTAVEKFHQYVDSLENEVQRLRLSSEIAGSEGALQQIKNHLCDFESTLDKRTKDLEGLHSTVSTTTCSSPSEDMSIRDVVHQEKGVYDECEVPLQQLSRLKEKLMRHSRAEDTAVKRIRDLEMQIVGLKRELEDSQTEREVLRKQISDHLVLISNLQIRLDEQRIRAEHMEKQTNTSLEVQNYDLKNTIASLEEMIAKRDKIIAQLNTNIEETKRRLEEREREEDQMIIQMQEQLELLRTENLKLKKETNSTSSEVEVLREKLSESERQLKTFTLLNLGKKEIDSLNNLRQSGISFHELLDLENLEQCRRAKVSNDSLQVSPIAPARKNEKTVFLEPEVSSIEKVGPPNLFYSLQIPNQKANSTEKHVRFEDEVESSKMLEELQKHLDEKDHLIKDYESRLLKLEELHEKVEQLQVALEETEANLKKATESFQEEQKENEEMIKTVRLELAAQRLEVTHKEEELEECKRQLEEEKKNFMDRDKEVKSLLKIKSELKTNLRVKDEEIKCHEETLKIQNEELKKMEDELAELKKIKDSLKKQNEDIAKELHHLQQLLAEKDKIIEQMEIDSKSLHTNLETIQNKLQETGNVVDLGKRLREEQKKNSALYEELHELKAQLLSVADRKSIDDIAERVQKELDYSAYLDSSLINAVNDGSLESEDLEALKIHLKKQRSVNKQLAKCKEAIEKKYEDLERKYDNLKRELDIVQYDDATLIGELRTKLDQAQQNQTKFDKLLKSEKKDKIELESQLKSMKHKMTSLSTKANSLPDMNHEYKGITKMIANLEEENNSLRQEIKTLMENSRRDLALKDEEIFKLECTVSGLKGTEKGKQTKLDKLAVECEMKTNELARTKKLMEEIDSDRKKLSKQLEQKSKSSSDPISEQLMAKLHELNNVVQNDRQMVSVIQGLKNENSVLVQRIAMLENRATPDIPFNDPVSRANYLFAKYLRAESYRKSLAWQKRYLISILETYQTDTFDNILAAPDWKKQKRKSQKLKFKTVAVMVISINRMKYLVRRWHSGRRIAEQRAAAAAATSNQVVQFHVGQPVSSQNFTSNYNTAVKSALNQPKTDMPWFGTSPPSKEPVGPNRVQSAFNFPTGKLQPKKLVPSAFQTKQEAVRTAQTRLSHDSTLTSPAMLSKYIDRFNQIQEKLGFEANL